MLLESVQSLLTIAVTPYPELDQTEQDLSFLRALYSNYQKFIEFDKRCVVSVCVCVCVCSWMYVVEVLILEVI